MHVINVHVFWLSELIEGPCHELT